MQLLRRLAVFLFFLFYSCQNHNWRISTLWTDIPEMALSIERFHVEQNQWQILVKYKENLALELLVPGQRPDLVITRYLTSKKLRPIFMPLSFLFENGLVAKSAFYKALLSLGAEADTSFLLPVSFDLPLLVYAPYRHPHLAGLSLDLDHLRQLNKKFHQENSQAKTKSLAFSPRWFAFTVMAAQGVNFREDFQSKLTWSQEHLDTSLGYLRSWIQNDLGGEAQEQDFTNKHGQDSLRTLLSQGRIDFYATTIHDFLALPQNERKKFDFRFPESQKKIPVEDGIIWAGIPLGSTTQAASKAFLEWFFQEATQKSLLAFSENNSLNSPGIARGFSSLIKVNEEIFPQYYAELSGRIPASNRLLFPNPLPLEWPKIKENLLAPWIQDCLQGKNPHPLTPSINHFYQENM